MRDIAILISTYNGEKYLKDQLDSILKQSIIEKIDIWIRDDGSTDKTCDILKKYATLYKNINVNFEENVGCVKSFFILLERVGNYQYYAFADQDDIWLPNKTEIAINKLSTVENPALYGGCSTLVDSSLKPIGLTQTCRREITFYNALIQNLMPGHTQVFNSQLKNLLLSNMDYSKIIVHDYWLTLVATALGTVIFDNDPKTLYRQHSNNEIGYGHGSWGWFTERLHRIKNQAAKKITRQDQYFLELYRNQLSNESIKECEAFLDSQNHLTLRIKYLFTKKVYRQKKAETKLFEILYLIGGYKI